jgi:phospholipid/cholesterol/gamma-HCH transport system ATP-binding protein
VGPAASGKSVLLKLLAGLAEADYGEIQFDSDVLQHDPMTLRFWQQRIGMVFQNNALFDFLSVAENVAFPLASLGYDPEDVRLRAEARLATVGLRGFGHRQVGGLSGGQKRRVGIARATITDAPFLLLDEPAAGLDPVSSRRIFGLLRREQQQRGATCIMVSSDVDRLLEVADRVALLCAGNLMFEGTVQEAAQSTDALVRQFLDGTVVGPLE